MEEDKYFLYELTEIASKLYQYVQVDGKKPLTQGEVVALAEGPNAIELKSNWFYMKHSCADTANKEILDFAKTAKGGKFNFFRKKDSLQIVRTNHSWSEITGCEWSKCYGLCGRTVCLEDILEIDHNWSEYYEFLYGRAFLEARDRYYSRR